MRPFRVEAPASPLITIDQLREHVRADTDEQVDLLEAYERAAVDFLDGYSGRLGRCVLRQKWALPLVGNPEAVLLPFPDCREFAIEQRDDQGVWAEIGGVTMTQMSDYVLLTDLPPNEASLHLTLYAGWESVGDVPNNLKQAVRLLVAHWNENRSAVVQGGAAANVPYSVDVMLQPLTHVFV